MENKQTGIIYTKTGETRRANIQRYHFTNGWDLWKHATKWRNDLRGMKPSEISETIEAIEGEYRAKFRIGFEVEKTYFFAGNDNWDSQGDRLEEYELFRGFETDSSCGVEAITHILPLLPKGVWRTKVFDMMHKARHILDEEYSASDTRCGGHATISVAGLSGVELMRAVRKFSGILHSLYRMRLYKSSGANYCNRNMTMRTTRGSSGTWIDAGYNDAMCFSTSSYGKYTFCKLGDDFIEFRVPPRVTSVVCLRLRYELFYELIKWSIKYQGVQEIPPNVYTKFLRAVKPIILRITGFDEAKTDIICREARHFQRFINSNGATRPQVVRDFILNTEEQNRRRDGRSNPRRERWKMEQWR